MNKDDWIIFGAILSLLCGTITLLSAIYGYEPGHYYWMWSDSWFGLLRDLHAEYNNSLTLLLKSFGIFFFVCVAFFWWIPFAIPPVIISWCIAKLINEITELSRKYKNLKKDASKQRSEVNEFISRTDDRF